MLKAKKSLAQANNLKLFKACEVNDLRKTYAKLWTDVKEETLPIVEEQGGFVIGKYKNKSYSLEIIKKNVIRFDVKTFKEKHPEIYDSFKIQGESVELKTKYKKS
jgi:hypothetical protein